jgi:hypothetical protein
MQPSNSVPKWPVYVPLIQPSLDAIGRWGWPSCEEPLHQLFQMSGQFSLILSCWIEDLICSLVPIEHEVEAELLASFHPPVGCPQSFWPFVATRSERIKRFKTASFSLQVEEHFSRTKRQRDRIIYSLLRCRNRSKIDELAIAIREGELDFSAAAIRFSEGPESAQGGRIGPIAPEAGHPELNRRLDRANEGDLIGPFPIGDMHVLLRLDTRITTRLDESLQTQLIEELYNDWLARQVTSLLEGNSIEPIEYLPAL